MQVADDEAALDAEPEDFEDFPAGPQGLRNLSWWADLDYAEFLAGTRAATEVDVPLAYQTDVADARAAVLLALEGAVRESEEEQHLWKLLTFMDRLLFATPPRKRGGVKHQHPGGLSRFEAALDRRIAHFWAGRWTELWREVELAGARAGEPRAASSRRKTMLDGRRPGRSPEPARAARIGGLVEAGELSRAAAAVVQNQTVRTEPGTLGLLRALYPAAPEGDHATGVILRSALLPAVREKIANKVAAALRHRPGGFALRALGHAAR